MCARVRVRVCALMLMVCVWTCYSVDVWMCLNFHHVNVFHDVNMCGLGGHQARSVLQFVAVYFSVLQFMLVFSVFVTRCHV